MKTSRPFFRIVTRIALGILLGVAAATAFVACSAGDAASPSLAAADASAPPLDGAQFVQARGCARCHQPSDPADGVLSGQTVPRPGTGAYGRNLTPDEETGIGAWSDEAILRAIRAGLDDQGSPLCATMPYFSDVDDAEGTAIVAYLRSLPPVKREIPESLCADAADAAPRDSGVVAPGRGDAEPAGDGDGSATAADADACALLPPSAPGNCHGCTVATSCNPNGCYGGYWCAPATGMCHRKPANCR